MTQRFRGLRHGRVFGGHQAAQSSTLLSGAWLTSSLSLPGGELQKPQSEPGGLPGKHEAASHDGGLQVEHETDRPLGPGQPQGGQSGWGNVKALLLRGLCWDWGRRGTILPGYGLILAPGPQEDLSMPLIEEEIDGLSGLLFPFYDADTHMLYLAGKVGEDGGGTGTGCGRPLPPLGPRSCPTSQEEPSLPALPLTQHGSKPTLKSDTHSVEVSVTENSFRGGLEWGLTWE